MSGRSQLSSCSASRNFSTCLIHIFQQLVVPKEELVESLVRNFADLVLNEFNYAGQEGAEKKDYE